MSNNFQIMPSIRFIYSILFKILWRDSIIEEKIRLVLF